MVETSKSWVRGFDAGLIEANSMARFYPTATEEEVRKGDGRMGEIIEVMAKRNLQH